MIGERVLGIYTVQSLLGEGGMGAVYLATSEAGHRIVIKVLHPELTRHAVMLERFRSEATNAARIRHPNVIEVMGTATLSDGRAFIALEYLEGKNLGEHLASWGKLSAEDAFPILLQLAAGLQGAHMAGIVHRDLKPDNVYLCDYPIRGRVKILDFGISKLVRNVNGHANGLTATGMLMGTPWYMAPEQAESARHVTPVSDIFAAGVIAFEMLAGVRPYSSDSPDDDGPLTFLNRYAKVAQGAVPRPSLAAATVGRDDIPRAWIEIIDRAISIAPAVRPQTIREFIEPIYANFTNGETLAKVLTPSLIEQASPEDATRRAAQANAVSLCVDGSGSPATVPGRFTAPHVPVSSTTFHGASGQVANAPPSRSRRIVPAVAVVVLGAGIVGAFLLGRSSGSEHAARPPSQPGAGVSSPDARTAESAPVAALPVDAAPTDARTTSDAVPIDATPTVTPSDAAAARPKRPTRQPRGPNDID